MENADAATLRCLLRGERRKRLLRRIAAALLAVGIAGATPTGYYFFRHANWYHGWKRFVDMPNLKKTTPEKAAREMAFNLREAEKWGAMFTVCLAGIAAGGAIPAFVRVPPPWEIRDWEEDFRGP